MQHHAHFRGACDVAVMLPAHIGQHFARVLIDMQRGVVARVIGKDGDGENPFSSGRQGDAVTGFNVAPVRGVDHLLQGHARCGGAAGVSSVATVFGVGAGERHGRVFHGPRHGLAGGGIKVARLQVRLRDVVPHRGRELVPQVGILLAPKTGPGHAADQHEQQQGGAPKTCHRVQVAPEHASAPAHARP